jgi:polyhydroxyalkanoate synthesis regulator phasin
MILIAVAGSLMLVAGIMFVIMSLRLQGRIAQLDEMVLAVGKRVVEMDASLELVGGAQEAIKTVLAKQAEMAAAQAKIDARLEEVIKNAQGVPEQTAKQVEARIQALSKQVSGLDARFAAQSAATNKMAGQVQSMQGALGDASAMKRDLEAMARQQRERQNSEAGRAAQEAAAARARENMVQYPRKSTDKP